MKILNLYAGIGGNRKLWNEVKQDIEVTAVELNTEIAKIYQDFFPNDKMIVGDAHEYLLNHFKEYDFIWSSHPCPSHSNFRLLVVNTGQNEPIYPDMKLYEEIIFLKQFYKGLFCIENVKSYYEPLIKPQIIGRHYYWSNFHLFNPKYKKQVISKRQDTTIYKTSKELGYNIKNWYKVQDKQKVLNNCVEPEIGKHILNCAINNLELF